MFLRGTDGSGVIVIKSTYLRILLALMLFLMNVNPVYAAANTSRNPYNQESDLSKEKIDTLVRKIQKKTKTPGISIVIVRQGETHYLNYGYADKENQVKPEQTTMYELGSVSKAYTATAILKLVKEGKLSLDDKVTKYLPWFTVEYPDEYDGVQIDSDVELTITQLLYHTSGIPSSTIGDIPEGNSDDMLEKTVRNVVGIKLEFFPGERFEYASLNYDILGLIIQQITGLSYEEYIETNVLEPLKLNHTVVSRNGLDKDDTIAAGYKINFFKSRKYDAPVYRGNNPAGYIISDCEDMGRWMKIQMGMEKIPEEFSDIISMTHSVDTSVAACGKYLYAGGWEVSLKGERIQHSGGNPNYSSKVVMYPEVETGVCVLTNINSNAADYLADNIINIILNAKVEKYKADEYKTLDILFSVVLVGSILLGVVYLVFLCKAFMELISGKRKKIKVQDEKVMSFVLFIPLVVFMGYCIYYLPNILMRRMSWQAVNVWGSAYIMKGCILGFFMLLIFILYIALTFTYTKEKEMNYVALIPLSLMNGIASSLIIFTINESFNRELKYSKELLVYFVFAILYFVYTTKLAQGRMIVITNEIAYEKRISMIESILSSTYQSIEQIGHERIYSGLNSDCAAVARIPEIVVGFVSNLLTVLFCLGYLMTKSMNTFVVSLLVIFINFVISIITSKRAEKYWVMNREIQDVYYGQMSDLVNGFKELVLSRRRRQDFTMDMRKYSRLSADMNKKVSIKYMNFHLYSTTVYNMIFGIIVFLFPIFIKNIDINLLRNNLFIVFYLIGPFNGTMDAIPQMKQIKIILDRIDALISDLKRGTDESRALIEDNQQFEMIEQTSPVKIEIKDLVYQYRVMDHIKQDEFILGPLSATFNSGQITFIIGGNGSGKSTFGKLITGLYLADEGEILVNGEKVRTCELNELFSSVYSDFNLFKRLYGFSYEEQKTQLDELLKQMELDEKVSINAEGEFDSLKFSTGQKKRLAYVIACLEDKPMIIFDEWAAEQDPRFREIFYTEILLSLKSLGKGIIVITHDDSYFELADQLIKLDHGTRQ